MYPWQYLHWNLRIYISILKTKWDGRILQSDYGWLRYILSITKWVISFRTLDTRGRVEGGVYPLRGGYIVIIFSDDCFALLGFGFTGAYNWLNVVVLWCLRRNLMFSGLFSVRIGVSLFRSPLESSNCIAVGTRIHIMPISLNLFSLSVGSLLPVFCAIMFKLPSDASSSEGVKTFLSTEWRFENTSLY